MVGQNETFRLLLIDRNTNDIRAYEESLENISRKITIHSTENEEGAFKYLDKNPPPAAIIFDLDSLIRRPIFIISEVKRKESLEKIPLVVIGDGSEAESLYLCLGVGVNQFIKRPANVEEFFLFSKRIEYLLKNNEVFPNYVI